MKHRRPRPSAVSVALGLGLLLSILFVGLQAAANAPTRALDSDASLEAVRAYQAGPLETRSAGGGDGLPGIDDEGLALVALIAVVVGFRVSGLARNSAARRRVPPTPS